MVLGATTAAAVAGASADAGGSLFGYNRKNFMYDRNMRQETEYQIMDYRIIQAELWRDDIRDIVQLTIVKMDTYLCVSTIALGFCVMAFCEGRLAPGTPTWLIGVHMLSLAGAFMYLLMSVWLAMHASVTAKSYEKRLLTSLVRLPMPTWTQLEAARTYSSTFERVNAAQMFRVPFALGTQESRLQNGGEGSVGRATGSASAGPATDLWGLEGRGDKIYELGVAPKEDPRRLRHFELAREAMKYWQSYDGFARVALTAGTNQLVTALGYYLVGYVIIANRAVAGAWCELVIFTAIVAGMIRLDMSLTGFEFAVAVLLNMFGPIMITASAEQWQREPKTAAGEEFILVVTPIVYVVHSFWLTFFLYIANVSGKPGSSYLPSGFRSVMYIDILGWMSDDDKQPRRTFLDDGERPQSGTVAGAGEWEADVGPAIQAARYEGSEPVATRLESLPGAPKPIVARPVDFDPETFTPKEKVAPRQEPRVAAMQPHHVPGLVPWRIFCGATTVLIVLWWTMAGFVFISSIGNEYFKVAPLLRQAMPTEENLEIQDNTLEEDLYQTSTLLANIPSGMQVHTAWPDANMRPRGLACGSDGTRGGGILLVSSTRFGLLTAHLEGALSPRVVFNAAPGCEGIEGEQLEDVALACNETEGPAGCRALVLHQHGRRLTPCPLSSKTPPVQSGGIPEFALGEVDEDRIEAQEEAASVVLSQHCPGAGGPCAYVETSKGDLLEARPSGAGLPEEAAAGRLNEDRWLPTRILRTVQASTGDGASLVKGGALALMGGRWLGVLNRAGTSVEILDAQLGKNMGQWRLPQDHDWVSMCAVGSHLFLMTGEDSPQLWRFKVPPALQMAMAGKAFLRGFRTAQQQGWLGPGPV